MRGTDNLLPLKVSLSVDKKRILPVQKGRGKMALSVSPFVVTLEHIAENFLFSDKRKILYAGLSDYIGATRNCRHPPLLQFISGSFLDDVLEPGDIDVASIVENVDEEAMPLLFDKAFTLARFQVDPIAITLRGDAAQDLFSVMRLAAFYSCRPVDGLARGFLCIA